MQSQFNMQSSIFIVFGLFHYEGETTLGVYTSYDKAVLALDEYKTQISVDRINGRYDLSDYDAYSIAEYPLNATIV